MDLWDYAKQRTHEREKPKPWEGRSKKVKAILDALKVGPVTTNEMLDVGTHRFACEILTLRERGYKIETKQTGKNQCTYILHGWEETKALKKGMQESYYLCKHWRSIRAIRIEFDEFKCTRCKTRENLQVHHWEYNLFNESTDDLQTYCDDCHSWLHGLANVKIGFPKFVNVETFNQLLAETK